MGLATSIQIIDNDEGTVNLSVEPATVGEDSTISTAVFTVSLSDNQTASRPISVNVAVNCNEDVTPDDFFGNICPLGSVTINAGEVSGEFSVQIADDTMMEDRIEMFEAGLGNLNAAGLLVSLSTEVGIVQVGIADNDDTPTDAVLGLDMPTYTVREGAGASLEIVVSVLSGAVIRNGSATVSVSTIVGSADGNDFVELDGQVLTFTVTDVEQRVSLRILDDDVVERDETFMVVLSTENEGITLSGAVAEVSDNDTDTAVVSLEADVSSIYESTEDGGDTVTFTVSFEDGATVAEDVRVVWSVTGCGDSDVTAGDFADTVCPAGSVTVAAGDTFSTFVVSARADRLAEGTERFTVRLDEDVTAETLSDNVSISSTENMALVTINDGDDAILSIASSRQTISEVPADAFGISTAIFTVNLEGLDGDGLIADEDILVNWRVVCSGDAMVMTDDFIGSPCSVNTLTISAGSMSDSFEVSTADDDIEEEAETFEVILFNSRAAVRGGVTVSISTTDGAEMVTIVDNEGLFVNVVPLSSAVAEGEMLGFEVSLSRLASADVVLPYEVFGCNVDLLGITAGDFGGVCPSDVVVIVSGTLASTVTLAIADDSVVEGVESFSLVIPIDERSCFAGRFPATADIIPILRNSDIR